MNKIEAMTLRTKNIFYSILILLFLGVLLLLPSQVSARELDPAGRCIAKIDRVSVGEKEVDTTKTICDAKGEALAKLLGLDLLNLSESNIIKTVWYSRENTTRTGWCVVKGIRSGKDTIVVEFSTTTDKCRYEEIVKTNAAVKETDIYTFNPGATETPSTLSGVEKQTAFKNYIDNNKCGLMEGSIYPGCFIQFTYGLFYVIPALLLWISAYFFNVLISLTLSSKLFADSTFIPEAWGIVRDLSNIFFILILLYISIKMIIGLAGHGVKEMIAKVIIMALLINFSMFFTGVVIDTSNMLALVFYNKLEVDTKVNGKSRDYNPAGTERDVAGGMVQAFNATSLLTPEFFETAGIIEVPGSPPKPGKVAPGVVIGITVVAGILMLFTAYCFLIAGLSFVARMIELFVLIIFSPFAFMSFALPVLSHVDYIGWDHWVKRLFSVSFMAPIFMFFMYFIFLLVQSPIFEDLKPGGTETLISKILLVIIPAVVILVLLLKATEFAKKGSGKFGEMVSKVGGVVGGFALGAATGGAAVIGRASLGRMGAAMGNSSTLIEAEARKGSLGFLAARLRDVGKIGGAASFDARAVKIGGKSLASTGMNVGQAQKGGFVKAKEAQIAKKQARAKELEVGPGEAVKKALNKTEGDLQELLRVNHVTLEKMDKEIQEKKDALTEANQRYGSKTPEAEKAGLALENAKARKKAFREGTQYDGDEEYQEEEVTEEKEVDTGLTDASGKKIMRKETSTKKQLVKRKKERTEEEKESDNYSSIYTDYARDEKGNIKMDQNGDPIKRTIAYLEKTEKREREHALDAVNHRRKSNYAKKLEGKLDKALGYIFSAGTYTDEAAEEAAYNIRTNAKIKDVDHGGGHKEEHKEDHGGGHGGAKEEPKDDHSSGHNGGGKEHGGH